MLIQPKQPCEIEVLEETYMTYRVPCRGLGSPVKIKIQYKSLVTGAGKRADLKVFASPYYKEPYMVNDCKPYYNVRNCLFIFSLLNSYFTPKKNIALAMSTSTYLSYRSMGVLSLCLPFFMINGHLRGKGEAAMKAL